MLHFIVLLKLHASPIFSFPLFVLFFPFFFLFFFSFYPFLPPLSVCRPGRIAPSAPLGTPLSSLSDGNVALKDRSHAMHWGKIPRTLRGFTNNRSWQWWDRYYSSLMPCLEPSGSRKKQFSYPVQCVYNLYMSRCSVQKCGRENKNILALPITWWDTKP